jgi:tetratricopeptide (TPR) repeat protein
MPPRKLRRRKIKPNPRSSDDKLFDKIKNNIKGTRNEEFVRRIITKLSLDPNISNLWFSLGLLLSEAHLYEEANCSFDKVVKLNPDHQKLWNSKANVLRKLGKHDEASDCYKKSLESFTGQLDGYHNLTELLDEIKERRIELGLEDFDDDALEYLTKNILDLDSFISELENLSEYEEGEKAKAAADSFSSKLDELEKISKPKGRFLSGIFGSKKE